jgi:hypothetical protein
MAEDTRYRSEHSRDEQGPDPLTELARLIGQSDPFADKLRRRASAHLDPQEHRQAPGWLARQSEPGYDQQGFADDPNAPQPYAAYRAPTADPHSDDDAGNESYDHYALPASAYDARHAEGHHADARAGARYADDGYEPAGDDRYRVAPPAGEYEPDEYYDDGHLPPRDENEGVLAGASRRGGLLTIAAVLGLAVIGTAGAFGYRAFTGPAADSAAPVIRADPNPAKLVPAAPSADAADKPFQERVGAPGTVQTERIVPREEAPVAQPVPPGPAVAPWPTPPRAGAPPPAAAAPPPVDNPGAKRVRTETIRVAPTGDPTGTTRPPAPVPNASPRGAKQNPAAPMTIGPSGEATPPPARVQTARVAPNAAADGAYVVQVSAQKTEGEAQSSYRALQQKYPNVLGGREATIRRADLGDKGVYYRAQIGGFASAAEATNFCDSLKASGGQCIVQKN